MMLVSDSVARYYNQNTQRFLRYGGSQDLAALHRQIWAPGVKTREAAFLFLNQWVAKVLFPVTTNTHFSDSSVLLDLGCGAGGTVTWIAQQTGSRVIGITNSLQQVQVATERAARLGLAERCLFVHADFLELAELDQFQGAWAIESFIHARDPLRFFQQAAAHLVPGGRLIVCDDFLGQAARGSPPSAQHWLRRFRQGWQVHSLLSAMDAVKLAEIAGLCLVDQQDFSPYLHSFTSPLLFAMKWLTRLPFHGAYWDNLSGGTALQICWKQGWTQYQALVFEKHRRI